MKKFILLISLLMLVTISVNGCGQAKKEENRDVKEQQAEDKDLSKFAGDWYVDGSLENGYLSISPDGKVESYSYEGIVNYEGELKCEEYENPDGTTGYIYNIYDDGGEFVIGFYEPEEEDFYEIYSGQDGEIHYVRSDHCSGSKT